ncbi:sialate O-acetylesterase [Staphylococcus arlettae]|uniref:sialate O-acetylesterase n=1 Tax=Staphylococcus arlettae TaxID=29378 RepID=UPI001E573447|nr:sialate O-acetylesterase [Staphylococcus arlettae]MCD8849374.1 sialate O-acetylesterase [Staphylococcus arlettae]MEB6067233.1 sialate O-acetylesterase [Staphylococcus arlettae]
MKSILLVGQSNMAGRGFITDVEPIINEHIKVLKNGRWQFMEEPIHQDRAVAGIGPAASFAQLWVDEHPNETLGLIPCADGGTSIDDWAPDQILTRHAISEAQFAMETSELIGVLWHQGENDSNNDKYQNYQEKLQQFIAHMRHALDQPDLPFIVGGLGDYLGQSGFGQSATQYQEINQIIQSVSNSDPHCYFVTEQGLRSNPDGIHINAPSQRIFGIRYYHAFSQLTDVLSPLPNEASLAANLYKSTYSKNEQMYLQLAAMGKNEITFEHFSQQMAEINKDTP